MTLAQNELQSLARAKLGNKLWKVLGPFRDEHGLYWVVDRHRCRSFQIAERVAGEHNRKLIAWMAMNSATSPESE